MIFVQLLNQHFPRLTLGIHARLQMLKRLLMGMCFMKSAQTWRING